MHVVIFTGGEFTKSHLTEKVLKGADTIVAADSGAEYAIQNNIYPTAVVGDLDSISKKTKDILQKHGTKFVVAPAEKDETDTELAVHYAVQLGAKKITLLGGNAGDRFDHVIANLLLGVVIPVPLTYANGNQMSWIEKGPAAVKLSGKKGNLLSLIPIGGNVEGVLSKNLQYALNKETLVYGMPRGVSNVFLDVTVKISFTKGMLLFVHTHS